MSKSKGGGTGVLVAVGAGVILAGMQHHAPAGHESTASYSTGSNVALGRRIAAADGWTGGQFSCLDALWTRESGWRADAVETAYMGPGTPTYAYGIPQANPADFGHPYSISNPAAQIRWGLKYIRNRYGTPCAAWAHETSHGWY